MEGAVDLLKGDQTVIFSENERLLVTNFNVPARIVGGDEEQYRQVLNRIADLLERDHRHPEDTERLYYYVTCTYDLVHSVTGETRLWTGSFSPRGNRFAQLSDFLLFERASFVERVQAASNIDNVRARLTSGQFQSTQWSYHSLRSIIVSAQAVVTRTNPAIVNRGLLQYPGRTRHVVFDL
jgi:hypothetical protein